MQNKRKMAVNACFWRLLSGCSLTDLAWLFRWRELHELIYIFDDESTSARRPLISELPWPVVLTLAPHSRKYISMPKSIPNIKKYKEDLQTIRNRIMWRSIPMENKPWWKKFISKPIIPICTRIVMPHVKAFADDVFKILLTNINSAIRAYKGGCRLGSECSFQAEAAQWLVEQFFVRFQRTRTMDFVW
jgi:hypothetical protein